MHVSGVLLPITISDDPIQRFHFRGAGRCRRLTDQPYCRNYWRMTMSHRFMTLLLSGTIGITATGCANLSQSPVTRAQSPPMQTAGLEQPMMGASCQNCQGMGSCQTCHDPNQRINLPFHPVHRNSYTVNTPKNMMYPPSPSQAGITQYPYYTFRGPTDFFMP